MFWWDVFASARGKHGPDADPQPGKRTSACGAVRGLDRSWVASIASGCATTTTERLGLPPLQTVAKVDLSRYTGTWYEIASYPQRFQKGCTGTTATYTLRDDGEIGVVNRCRKGSLDGEEDSAHPSNCFSGGGVMVVVAASGRVTGVPKVRFVRLA